MRCCYLLYFFIPLLAGTNEQLHAQEQRDPPTRLLRIYEDNDFMNIHGPGTDDAYTAGTRIDLFYTKKSPSRSLPDRLLPKAGDSSVNVFGWGVMQLMCTPDDIGDPDYQPDDYPWSGALIATHTLYSYNPDKKYDLQTELVLGVLGPASFAEQTQRSVHHLLRFQRPRGWDHQFRNALLANINFTAEKQLLSWGQHVEVIGGGQVFLGSMLNELSVYPLIRIGIGKPAPYFNGFFSQYTGYGRQGGSNRNRKPQIYFILKPQTQLVFTNALLEGGLFSSNPNLKGNGKGTTPPYSQPQQTSTDNEPPQPYHDLRHVIYSVSYGCVATYAHFGISFMQWTGSALMKGLYTHDVENLSIYYAW